MPPTAILGLNQHDMKKLKDLLVKANPEQLFFMEKTIVQELQKRGVLTE